MVAMLWIFQVFHKRFCYFMSPFILSSSHEWTCHILVCVNVVWYNWSCVTEFERICAFLYHMYRIRTRVWQCKVCVEGDMAALENDQIVYIYDWN